MGLEEILYGSKDIRHFLKLFSEQNWNRVSKATIILGIQYLKKLTSNDLRKLSIQDIENFVVAIQEKGIDKAHQKKKDKKQKRARRTLEESNLESSKVIDASGTINSSIQDSQPPSVREKKHKKQKDQEERKRDKRKNKPENKERKEEEENKIIAPKPSSQWRRNASQPPEEKRRGNFQSESQPNLRNQKNEVRSASLNPQIYPSWWGEDSDFEKEIQRHSHKNAPTQRKEDSLDKRLREAEKKKKQNQLFQDSPEQKIQMSKVQQDRTPQQPNFAYTSSKQVATYSPVREARAGANNIPMSYAGPPSQAEINRNNGRHLHNKNYQAPREERRESGFQRGGDGRGAVMSYSPPGSRKNTANFKKDRSKKELPMNESRPKKQRKNYIPPSTQTTGTQPKKFKNVESKIKTYIQKHKQDYYEKKQYKQDSPDKETKVYYKKQDPTYHPNENYGGQKSAALRRRSPLKESATSSNYNPQQQKTFDNQGRKPTYGNETSQDQFSLKNTQGQWPSSIENLNNSNNRSTGQYFYNQHQRQATSKNQPSSVGVEVGYVPGEERNPSNITGGLMHSPIMSNSDSSPERQYKFTGEGWKQGGRPSYMQHDPLQQNYMHPNESSDQVVLFRSDGFEQSKYYNMPHQHTNQSRFSKTPTHMMNPVAASQADMNTSNFSGPSQGGHLPTQQLLDNSGAALRAPQYQARISNPFSKNQNQSSMSGVDPAYQRRLDSGPGMSDQKMPSEYYHQNDPRGHDWVGNYKMNNEPDQRSFNQLAQANSYTYTLQNPLYDRGQGYVPPQQQQLLQQQQQQQQQQLYQYDQRKFNTFQDYRPPSDDEDDEISSDAEGSEEEESEISNYSPQAEFRQGGMPPGQPIMGQANMYIPKEINTNIHPYQPQMLQGQEIRSGNASTRFDQDPRLQYEQDYESEDDESELGSKSYYSSSEGSSSEYSQDAYQQRNPALYQQRRMDPPPQGRPYL